MRANRQHEVLVAPPDSQGACRALVEEAKPDALLDAHMLTLVVHLSHIKENADRRVHLDSAYGRER